MPLSSPPQSAINHGMDENRIEPLSDQHDRGEFSCGKPSLDSYFHFQAKQHAKKGISRTFVICPVADSRVLGFYTLVASSVAFEELPTSLSKKLPKHPIPVILLARLAVDKSYQGRGIGSELLMDAFTRAVSISLQLGVYGIHVHALDADAASFYAKYGFAALPDQERHMFLTVETIRPGLGG